MSEVNVKNPWVVEVAAREYSEASYLLEDPEFFRGGWEFSRAFESEHLAMIYAKRKAEEHEWVRVAYRDV